MTSRAANAASAAPVILDTLPIGWARAAAATMTTAISPASQTESGTRGNPRYCDIIAYLAHRGHPVSESALGRYALHLRTIGRLKAAGVLTREIMSDLSNERSSQAQKAAAEMITAVAIEFVSSHESLEADELRDVAKAMKDCASVAIASDKYVRQQIEAKAAAADKSIAEIAAKKQIDPETLKLIREQVYGIVS